MKRALSLMILIALSALMLSPAFAGEMHPTLGMGSRGAEVTRLQQRLIELSFLKGKADGQYGQQTANAVRAAQQYLIKQGHPLAADGVAGPQTLGLLYDDLAMKEFLDLKTGSRGSRVTALQTQLYDLNLLPDRPDAAFGPRTEQALRQLQQMLADRGASGVQANGIFDKATRDALAGDLSGFGIQAPAFFNDQQPGALSSQYLYARSALVMDAASGQVLFDKSPDQRMYPASTTKIMTLLVALEKGRLDQAVTVPQAAGEVPKDSSLVPIYPGEKMTLKDLLFGLMIKSGNDAANAIAVKVSGSVDKFVAEMNRKAQELGLQDTHFTNPHGYHHKEHYTTARDLATLTRHAMKNNAFVSIAASLEYELPPTSRREALILSSNTELLQKDSPFFYQGAYGVKSGYTRAAGFCYVGAAENNGRQLIAVVLDCRTRNMAWEDMKRLFNYGFAQ